MTQWEKILLRVPEVCTATGYGRSFVLGLLDKPGGLPTVRVGRTVRIPAIAVQEWVDRQLQKQDAKIEE